MGLHMGETKSWIFPNSLVGRDKIAAVSRGTAQTGDVTGHICNLVHCGVAPLSGRRQGREVKLDCHCERSDAIPVVLKIASSLALLAVRNSPICNFPPLPADKR